MSQEKAEKKIKLVTKMIGMYCKKHHVQEMKGQLCDDCGALLDYTSTRTRKCRNLENGTFCAHCTTPCYAPDKRGKMRQVMKFSGPRLIFYHPVWVMKHILEDRRNKRGKKRSKNG